MQEPKFATVKGACDLHCHAGKPSCDERPFTDITDSLAKDVSRWIYEKKLSSLIRANLTDAYLKKLAALIFKLMCIEVKGKEWVDKHWDNSLPR